MNTLIELLETALKDMRAVKEDQRYIFDVAVWHIRQSSHDRCHVCIAGAVMANTLGVDIDLNVSPYDFEINIKNKLKLINTIREGKDFSEIYYYFKKLGWQQIDIEVMYDGIDKERLQLGDDDEWVKLIENLKKAGVK